MIPIKMVVWIYLGMVFTNLVIASLQFYFQRNPIHKRVFLYWAFNILGFVANSFVKEPGVLMISMASFGIAVGQVVIGMVFAEVRGTTVRLWPVIPVYFVSLGTAILLLHIGVPFDFAVLPGVFGCVFPFFYYWVAAARSNRAKTTFLQRSFLVTTTVLSLHQFDWGFVVMHSEAILPGFMVAFALFHILSILMPMMANEMDFSRRLERLEDQVEKKAGELSLARIRLSESNKMASLGRLAGGMAHEINNPLAIIRGSADLLEIQSELGSADSEAIADAIRNIRGGSGRISGITGILRTFAKEGLGAGKTTVAPRTLVEEVIRSCGERLRHTGITLAFEADGISSRIYGNAFEISHAIREVLENAMDAIEKIPVKLIQVRLSEWPGILQVHIEDSGRLDPSVSEKIMDPFFTTKAPGKGAGLGLSLARAIVEHAGGRLFLDPSSPRTLFILEFPSQGSAGA